ncbi:hypothetical protein AVEN_163715-1 [Araneus ventricosus]|uniref:Uncharacterized protein n=1 Tax=Araneus ventricosus TaxID=182803 RepID=A0A4Y2I1E1_ARAVE|nr:hypothetical protein AVEN_163715-1 [Araneus ventricosus]
MVIQHYDSHKEHHPALPKYPGKLLNDWPPQQIVRHCCSCIIAPLRAAHATTPRFTWVRPVIGSGPKESHHYYCAIGLTRACLLTRQPLIREHAVSPDGFNTMTVRYKHNNLEM